MDVHPRRTSHHRAQPERNLAVYAPSPRRRLGALLVDVVMFVLLVMVAYDLNPVLEPGVVLGFAWVIVRALPIVLLGQTAGQTLAGYEIRGARGDRIGPLRAAARDLLLLTSPSWLSYWLMRPSATPAPFLTASEGGDGRWPHDTVTNTWAVRSKALRPAVAPQTAHRPAR